MPALTVTSLWPLFLLAVLPVVWWLAWHSRASVARARVPTAAVLRTLALAAIAAALMQPVLHRDHDEVSVVYAMDVSGSISRPFISEALHWIAQINAEHRPAHSRLVAFSGHAQALDSGGAVRDIASAQVRTRSIGLDATNIENGLLTALAELEPGDAKRIVLLSDGRQTEGDVWRTLPGLRSQGVRVFAVPAALLAENDAWPEQLFFPSSVREGAVVEAEARIHSLQAVSATVELRAGEQAVVSRQIALAPGSNQVSLSFRNPRGGSGHMSLRVSAAGDQMPLNDLLVQDVPVQPRPHVLYVDGGEPSAKYLAEALTAQGIRVSAAAPEDLLDARVLADKDAVILSDVRSESLDAKFVQQLQVFVRDRGGGLIFAAGPNTYGKDSYAKGGVEQLLPVTFEAKRKHEDLDLVLLVDRSSSMRGRKIEVSKSAALATLDLLDEEHRLAVVAFDAKPHDVMPLMAVGNKHEAQSLIARMTSSGQTNIYNALVRARELLANSKAGTKHIILLSDGLTAPAPGQVSEHSRANEIEERLRAVMAAERSQAGRTTETVPAAPAPAKAGGFPGIVAELAAEKISLSTVAIGEKPDVVLMADLAARGNGKSYVAKSDAEVPTLFAAETHRLLGDSIVEEPFRAKVLGMSPAMAGIDFATAPELKGYVAAKAKRFSDVLLEAKKDLPLLAETHYGLGKTVAFLSDVKDRWAADWLRWPGYAKFWAQVVRDAARHDSGEGVRWQVEREGNNALLELSALGAGGIYRDDLWPQVRVTNPNGRTEIVALRQMGPGRYGTEVPLSTSPNAPWRFELMPSAGLGAADIAHAANRTVFYAHTDEYRLLPANVELLRTLSEQTGGVFAPQAEEIFRPRGDSAMAATPLWIHCVAGALVLFLLDILVRRAPWRWRRGNLLS